MKDVNTIIISARGGALATNPTSTKVAVFENIQPKCPIPSTHGGWWMIALMAVVAIFPHS